MYLQIHSRSDDSPEHGGKTSWINTNKILCAAKRTAPDHLGKPAWHLEISASATYALSSGERGGDPKYMNRKALLQLTAEDLEQIIRVAAAEGFVLPKSSKVVK